MRACLRERSADACVAREWAAAQQLAKGMYAVPMAAWLAVYPREQLLILTLDELRRGARIGGKLFPSAGKRVWSGDSAWVAVGGSQVKQLGWRHARAHSCLF